MNVQVVSFSRDRLRAEIVVKSPGGGSRTRHVIKEKDGRYHYRRKVYDVELGVWIEVEHEKFDL